MGAMSRTKGKAGEREVAAILAELTGHHVRRRVRQHDGDDDLMGLPGWSVEVKRYETAPPARVSEWWRQAVRQAQAGRVIPLLCYRVNRGQWRFMWPAGLHCADIPAYSQDANDALESDPLTWWRMTRKICGSFLESLHGGAQSR